MSEIILKSRPREVRAIKCLTDNLENIRRMVGSAWKVDQYVDGDTGDTYFELVTTLKWDDVKHRSMFASNSVIMTVEAGEYLVRDNDRLEIYVQEELPLFFEWKETK